MRSLTLKLTVGAAALLFLAACGRTDLPIPPATAQAELKNSDGDVIGTAMFVETGDGVQMNLNVSDLTPGLYGLQIRQNGECDPPDFQSAGGVFNPTGQEPGDAAGGPHLGDLRDVEVNNEGEAEIERMIGDVTLRDDAPSILGKAAVIHARAVAGESQPSGDAGARVACGVIEVYTPATTKYPIVN